MTQQTDPHRPATLSVRVWRGSGEGAYAVYDVPRRPSQTVLDVVTHIQRQIDPTLAYRYACRVGMCGSCAMTVNGRARWTCRTHVEAVAADDALTIGPLAHLPVIRDLVTDMREFFDKWARAKGAFVPAATHALTSSPSPMSAAGPSQGANCTPSGGSPAARAASVGAHTTGRGEKKSGAPAPRIAMDDFVRIDPASKARRAADAAIECIGCGICYASCDVVAWNRAYLGPAALNRAWTLHNDPRDGARTERLAAIAGDAGCHACHTHQSCTERCPKKLAPTASIAGLKRAVAQALVSGELA